MKRCLIALLAACGSGDAEPTVACDVVTLDDPDDNLCRIDTEGLYIDPATQCVWVHDGSMSDSGLCQAIGAGNVTLRASVYLDGKRGVVVASGDTEFPAVCVFRECQ